MRTRPTEDTFENDNGDRFVLGTHDPQDALDVFNQDAADTDRLVQPLLLCETDTAEFRYRWYRRIEPAHPAYEFEYAETTPNDPYAVPGIWLPAS